MGEISHSDELVTKQDLSNFYQGILPYLGGMPEGGYTPVGTIISVMGNSAPEHYIACNGQTVAIVDYPELASYFEEQFGSKNKFGGDGTTTFGIPDLRGEFLRGTGTNGHTSEGNGSSVGVHQDATRLLNFVEDQTDGKLFVPHNSTLEGRYRAHYNQDKTVATQTGHIWINGNKVSETNNNATYITPRPTNTSVLYCIATKNIYMSPLFDYSDTEKVVGKWIDGRPLYQKTVVVTSPASAGVDTIVTSFDAHIQPREMVGLLDNTIPLNYNGTNEWYTKTRLEPSFSGGVITGINIRMIVAGYTSRVTRITIRYTRDTD